MLREMPSSEKKPNVAKARRESLLRRIEAVFLREGVRALTVGELAARLRCSRRAFYELAASKEELFVVVLDRVLTRIDRGGRAAADAATGVGDKIAAFIEPGVVELAAATPSFFADIAAHPVASRRLRKHQDARQRALRALIEQGVRSGECRKLHAELAAHAVLAAYRAVTDASFLSKMDLSIPEAVRETCDLFLQGLLHPED
jgi:AcrR family transcriptional regulator